MNRKKLIAAVVAVITALGSALGVGLTGLSTASDTSERVRALEVREEEILKRLDRMENKLDWLVERGGK